MNEIKDDHKRRLFAYGNDSFQFTLFQPPIQTSFTDKKKSSFQQVARSFPTRRIFNKSVLPINMSSRRPQYISVECNQMQLPYIWKKITILSNPREENCALLGYYAASRGNFVPTFQDNLSAPPSRVKNKKKKMGRREQFSSTSRQKPEITNYPWEHKK